MLAERRSPQPPQRIGFAFKSTSSVAGMGDAVEGRGNLHDVLENKLSSTGLALAVARQVGVQKRPPLRFAFPIS